MATTSYGSITIVDITDVGEFSVYPQANTAQTQLYNPDSSGDLAYTPNWADENRPIVITPVAFYAGTNKSNVATYSWKKYINGVEANFSANEVVANTARHETLTISANILTTVNPIITYEVTASYSSVEFGETPLTATGRIDFSLITQGSAAKTVKITGANTFAYDAGGQLKASSANPILLTATYTNSTESGWKYKAGNNWFPYPLSFNGESTTTGGNNPTLKVFDQQTDNGLSSGNNIFNQDQLIVRYEAIDNRSTVIYDEFTITKIRDGGIIATAVLTNDNQMIPAERDGTPTSGAFGEATTTQIKIYDENGELDTNNWYIDISGTTGLTYQKSLDGTNWVASTITGRDYAYVKVTGITQAVDTGNILFTCTHKTDATATRIEKVFSLVKVKAGQDGDNPVIYDIQSDVVAVNRAKNDDGTGGAYSPASVTFTAYRTEGNTTSTWEDGFIRILADNVVKDSSTTARGVVQYTLSTSPGARVIRAELYSTNDFANATPLASQSVIVTNDGSKGADGLSGLGAINVIIDNEHDGLVCTAGFKTTEQQVITIHFTGYQGTTSRSTTITLPNISGITPPTGGQITKSVSGNTITYTIPSGSTLAARGSIELNFQVLGQHYDEGVLVDDSSRTTVTKMFTWSRSSTAADAISLVMEYPEGQVFQNSSGNALHIQAIVYDGGTIIDPSEASYIWKQYDGTLLTDDKYGDLQSGASASGNILTINPIAVNSYASFRVEITYPIGGTTKYRAFGSIIDKFDPLQVSVHSTVGTQIKNGQGFGALFVKVMQEDEEIDPIPLDVEVVTSTSQADANATYCIVCVKPTNTEGTTDTVASRGSATLYKKVGNSWTVVSNYDCSYNWTYHNFNGETLGSGERKPATTGKCVYIDASLIQSKITADVTVVKN